MPTDPLQSVNLRALAATLVGSLLQGNGSLTQLLANQPVDLSRRDQALLAELCYGAVRFHPELSGLIAQLLNRPVKAKDSDIQALLLIGAYQLRYTRIPDHAAISETVAATRNLGKPWAKGLTNAVLRSLQRRHDELDAKLTTAAKLNHPEWILRKLRQQWPEHWQAVVAANNRPAPMTVRVNRRQYQRDTYLQALSAVGIDATHCHLSADGIQLDQACDVTALPDFSSGSCSIQDEASQLVAELFDLDRGRVQRLLDSCSAPGGKTTHLLERFEGIELDALDLDAQRLLKVRQNLQRLNLDARILQGDARQPSQWWNGSAYDAILLDAPCSTSGVIRRHPDIKVLRQARHVAELTTQQRAMLSALWPCLRPGGQLIYTTCSVFDEENAQVVEAFLEATPDARHEPLHVDWGHQCRYGRQLLPEEGGHDGFYYARLRKAV